ncbi:hypothetical protein GCK72_021107 [Caenorhabditis remanei]|uniref:F-box domain-containing protein n=1 Tax=Caenorhabditis remanei TaxID=31234 RepID=A0A6A5GIC8_CAERE|nr:hypothetical protein GCK72_021107 [Caenorhabditis remanei]KAF1754544.1 hypothetical protein GCK72_021107 [Caenorhabditis remanei]
MTTSFPLLRLPYPVLKLVLEQMKFVERIVLSLLSKRARMFLKLLKMKCKYINLILDSSSIKMNVFFDNSKELKVDILILEYPEVYFKEVYFKHEYDYIAWRPCALPPLDYFLPIMDVTHCKSIKQFIIVELPQIGILLGKLTRLLAKLPEIDEVVAQNTYHSSPDSPLIKVLRMVLPVSSAVTVSYHALKPKDFREIFKGNFDAVTLKKFRDRVMPNHGMKFSLNDLKMTNVKSLELPGPVFTLEDLNRYFKLWMKKQCNPRLEYLQVAMRWVGSEEINILLKGLNAVQVPIRTDRTLGNIKQFISEVEDEMLISEIDITRADEKTATIRISNYGTVCFYVWLESTNLEQN